jgi:FkbM family methyltransferase
MLAGRSIPAEVSMLEIVRVAGHSFVADWIAPGSVVLDFGMNRGAFSTRMLQLFDCRIAGAEAHPGLWQALPRDARLDARHVAIAGGPGTMQLALYAKHCASGVLAGLEAGVKTVAVPTVGLGAFCDQVGAGEVALLKCDIEGAELAMLDGARDADLLRLGQITIEFHDFLDATQRPVVQMQLERLRQLGFWAVDMSKNRMDVLLVNQRRHPLGALAKAQIVATKYRRAAGRIVRRRFGWVDSGEDGCGALALRRV